MVVRQERLAHLMEAITSPHIIQDLPFGEKVVSLLSKEVINIPSVVRNMTPERIVYAYFTPLSRSTFLRLLEVCPASTWKSLQGIDYNSLVGAQAFGNIGSVA